MTDTYKGRCLCGAVQVEGRGAVETAICHCQMCRRWHGGPGIAANFSDGIQILSGETNIGWYESSEWAARGFCKTCGSTLFYRLKSAPDELSGEAGTFDLPDDVPVKEHYFIDEKPGFYDFTDTAPRLTGQETFDKYADGGADG